MHAHTHTHTHTLMNTYTTFTSRKSGMCERRQADFVVCPWIDTQGWSHLIPQAVKSTSSPSSFLMFWQTLSDWGWGWVRRKWGVGGVWRSEGRTGAWLVPLMTPGFLVDVIDQGPGQVLNSRRGCKGHFLDIWTQGRTQGMAALLEDIRNKGSVSVILSENRGKATVILNGLERMGIAKNTYTVYCP